MAATTEHLARGQFRVGPAGNDTVFTAISRDGSDCVWLLIGDAGRIFGTVDYSKGVPELGIFEIFNKWNRSDLRDAILAGVAGLAVDRG